MLELLILNEKITHWEAGAQLLYCTKFHRMQSFGLKLLGRKGHGFTYTISLSL